MRRILSAVFALAALHGGALAADLPARAYTKAPKVDPGINWSGFYAGVNAGYGRGSSPTSLDLNVVEQGVVQPGLDNPLPPTLRPDGFIGGGQVGYNAQFGSAVAGLEADIDFSNLRKTDAATGAPYVGGQLTTTIDTRLDWFGTLRGRLGVLPVNNVLLYATGGLAYGHVRTTTTGSNLPLVSCNGPGRAVYCATGTTSDVSVGWTVGGGIEYAFAPNWTIRGEYLYLDLGSRSVTFPDRDVPGGILTSSTSFTAHIGRAGLNYRF
ncbi:MAG: porin family protein [Bradyrhizobium sp.]|nr:porin family protein [Bradyrhizobium sp.]